MTAQCLKRFVSRCSEHKSVSRDLTSKLSESSAKILAMQEQLDAANQQVAAAEVNLAAEKQKVLQMDADLKVISFWPVRSNLAGWVQLSCFGWAPVYKADGLPSAVFGKQMGIFCSSCGSRLGLLGAVKEMGRQKRSVFTCLKNRRLSGVGNCWVSHKSVDHF